MFTLSLPYVSKKLSYYGQKHLPQTSSKYVVLIYSLQTCAKCVKSTEVGLSLPQSSIQLRKNATITQMPAK